LCEVTVVVEKISNCVLLSLRQITSSRQSPSMSADKPGLALVPLFCAAPYWYAVSRRLVVLLLYFHLSIVVPFNNSRLRSASQYTPKLIELGLAEEIKVPFAA